MLGLDSGDKIRGDASVANVVDYTLHGTNATTVLQLADGQLAAAIGDLYTAGANDIHVATITLVNTDSSARTVNLYLTPSGGTARRLIPKDLSLGAGYSLTFDGQKIQVMDTSGNILTSINLASPTFSGTVTISSLTASEIVATNASKQLVSLAVATYPSLTELSYVKGVTSALQTQMNLKAPLISPSFTTPTLGAAVGTSLQLSGLTASEILGTDASKNLVSLAVATYPSLAELAYVKGVTSALQTQLGLKAPLASPTFSGTVTLPSTITVGAAVLTFPGATGTLATLAGAEELDNKTLDSSVGKGTWTASGTWTLPAFTLGGTLAGNGQKINRIEEIVFDNETAPAYITMGSSNNANSLTFRSWNAAGALTNRLVITNQLNTVVATWTGISHTGLVITSAGLVEGAGTGANGFKIKNPKNAAATALSGTQLDVEIDIGGTPYYFTVYPTKA